MIFVPNADIESGGHLCGYFTCSYAVLLEKFGPPNSPGDGYKVSTEWQFASEDKRIVCTLYDWKVTELYEGAGVTVEEFRKWNTYEWHVGAEKFANARLFIDWLRATLGTGSGRVTEY